MAENMITLIPPTKGSQKQIEWATHIQKLFCIRYQYALGTLSEQELDQLNQVNAQFWITNRHRTGTFFTTYFREYLVEVEKERIVREENKQKRRQQRLANCNTISNQPKSIYR